MKALTVRLLATVTILVLMSSVSFAAVPNTFTNNTVADANDVNANFNYFENKFSPSSGHDHDASDSKTITTLGTVSTGTWNGSIIDEVYGGTGANSYATGDLVYATASTVLGKIPIDVAGSILTVDSTTGLPKWLRPGTSGQYLTSQGVGSDLLYATLPAIPDFAVVSKNVGEDTNTALKVGTFTNQWIIYEAILRAAPGAETPENYIPGGSSDDKLGGGLNKIGEDGGVETHSWAYDSVAQASDHDHYMSGMFYSESGIAAPSAGATFTQPCGVIFDTSEQTAPCTFSEDVYLYVDSTNADIYLAIGAMAGSAPTCSFSIYLQAVDDTAL